MKFRMLLCFCTLAFPVFVPTVVAGTDRTKACPVTTSSDPGFIPPQPWPPYASEGTFWYGTSELWTQLEREGVWYGLPHDDKGYSNKLFLWQQDYDWRKEPQPEIIVILERLDTHVPLVLSHGGTNAILDNGSAMLTGVTFPTEGCWEVTSYHAGHTLNFTVSVQP